MGAPRETEYEAKLAAAGFEAISSEPTRVYDIEGERVFLTDKGIDVWTPSRRRWKASS